MSNPSLALVLSDELAPANRWVRQYIVVGLDGGHPRAVELAVLRWVTAHSGELGAPDDRVLVAGGARAARLALAARDSGWPAPRRQLLVHPSFTNVDPMPDDVEGAPAATVVCAAGLGGAHEYAERLRAAAVDVDEVHDDGQR